MNLITTEVSLWFKHNFLYCEDDSKRCARAEKEKTERCWYSFLVLLPLLQKTTPSHLPPPTNHSSPLSGKELFYPIKTQQPSKIYQKNTCKTFLPTTCPRQGSSGTLPCDPPLLQPLEKHPEWWRSVQKFIVDVAYWDQGSYPSPHKKDGAFQVVQNTTSHLCDYTHMF